MQILRWRVLQRMMMGAGVGLFMAGNSLSGASAQALNMPAGEAQQDGKTVRPPSTSRASCVPLGADGKPLPYIAAGNGAYLCGYYQYLRQNCESLSALGLSRPDCLTNAEARR